MALSLAGTRQSMERLVGVKTSLGLSCPGAGAPTPNGSPERLWRTDATDPCTLASAPRLPPVVQQEPHHGIVGREVEQPRAPNTGSHLTVCGKGPQHLVGHCLNDVLDEGAPSHDGVGGAGCLGDRWCGVG